MIDKDYLDKLKEEDYIAWDSLVNDPSVTGSSNDTGCIMLLVSVIALVIVIIWIVV